MLMTNLYKEGVDCWSNQREMLSVDGEMSLTEIGASLQDRNAKEVNAGEDGNEEKC